jgi:hypothetical protein
MDASVPMQQWFEFVERRVEVADDESNFSNNKKVTRKLWIRWIGSSWERLEK